MTAYLNDHLAGSVAAIELIDDLIDASDDASLRRFFAALKRDIESDQKVLDKSSRAAARAKAVIRKVAAWVSEKAARAKFKVAGENLGGLGLVQALEMLALGIRGKELLWRASRVQIGRAARYRFWQTRATRGRATESEWKTKRWKQPKAAFGNQAL